MKDTKDHSKKCGRSSRSNLQKNPNLNPILKLQHNSEEHIQYTLGIKNFFLKIGENTSGIHYFFYKMNTDNDALLNFDFT